jgi:hypothetical protein
MTLYNLRFASVVRERQAADGFVNEPPVCRAFAMRNATVA